MTPCRGCSGIWRLMCSSFQTDVHDLLLAGRERQRLFWVPVLIALRVKGEPDRSVRWDQYPIPRGNPRRHPSIGMVDKPHPDQGGYGAARGCIEDPAGDRRRLGAKHNRRLGFRGVRGQRYSQNRLTLSVEGPRCPGISIVLLPGADNVLLQFEVLDQKPAILVGQRPGYDHREHFAERRRFNLRPCHRLATLVADGSSDLAGRIVELRGCRRGRAKTDQDGPDTRSVQHHRLSRRAELYIFSSVTRNTSFSRRSNSRANRPPEIFTTSLEDGEPSLARLMASTWAGESWLGDPSAT